MNSVVRRLSRTVGEASPIVKTRTNWFFNNTVLGIEMSLANLLKRYVQFECCIHILHEHLNYLGPTELESLLKGHLIVMQFSDYSYCLYKFKGLV